ncbi:MAG: FtsX-like permease family protein [Planctomycetota bacterium]
MPENYAEKIGQMPQVEAVMPVRIAAINSCKLDPEMVVIHGIDKEKFLRFREFKIEPAILAKFREDKIAVLVGTSIARRKDWRVGQEIIPIQELNKSFTVVGIFFTGNEEQDNYILADYRYIQDAQNKRGWCNLIYINVKEGYNADALATEIDSQPWPVGTRTQPEKAFIGSMLQELIDIVSFTKLIILITFLVMLIGIANTISMSIRDRTRQIGVMRTLGYTRTKILSLILMESVVMSLIGGLLGCLCVFGIFQWVGVSVQIMTYGFTVNLNLSVAVMGIVLAVLVGLLGTLLPAYQASRLNIVNSLRNMV